LHLPYISIIGMKKTLMKLWERDITNLTLSIASNKAVMRNIFATLLF